MYLFFLDKYVSILATVWYLREIADKLIYLPTIKFCWCNLFVVISCDLTEKETEPIYVRLHSGGF